MLKKKRGQTDKDISILFLKNKLLTNKAHAKTTLIAIFLFVAIAYIVFSTLPTVPTINTSGINHVLTELRQERKTEYVYEKEPNPISKIIKSVTAFFSTTGFAITGEEIDLEYVELLVKTSDNKGPDNPIEERRGNAKQGYIIEVKPEGWSWGRLERDPKRFAIITIPKAEWNESWLEPEYDYDKPIYSEDGKTVNGYEVKTMRKYKLPIESFMSNTEISTLKDIPYNDKTERPAITKLVENITEKVIVNKWEIRSADWVSHGSSGNFTMCPLGCDYSTLNAFESGEEANLTDSGPCVLKINDTWASEDTTAVTFDGWTTTANDYVYIYTEGAARHDGKWNSSAYRITSTTEYGKVILVNEDYVRIFGLQIYGNSPFCEGISITGAGEYQIAYNIFKGGSDNLLRALATHGANDAAIIKAWNNIAYNFGAFTYDIYNSLCTLIFYSNTIYNMSSSGLNLANNASKQVYLKNILVQNSTINYIIEGLTFTADSCLSEDDTSPNVAYLNKAISFVNLSSEDFHLLSSDTNATDQGIDLSSDAGLNFTDDIDGNIRTGTWDIGADEYMAANNAPSDPAVSLSPLDGTAAQDLTCTATVNDSDPSDTLTASIEWFKNNESNYSVSAQPVTNNVDFTYVFTASGNLTSSDEWGCGIAIDDQTINSSWVNATQFTVISANNAPTAPDLNAPENNTYLLDSSLVVPLNWSNSTDADGDAITYYLEVWNESEMQNIMYVNASIAETANTTGDVVTFPNETNADFFWRVLATDGTANSSWSELRNISIGYTIFPDSTPPTVNLELPENNTFNTTSNNIDFTYNVSDSSNVDNCSLIISGGVNITSTSVTKDTSQNLTTYLPNAEYNWSVNCTDSVNNIGASEVRNISVNNQDWYVWVESLLADKIRPTYNPDSKNTSIGIKGAKNEWLAFQILIRSDSGNISNFVPSVESNLTKDGDTIADTNWKFYMVQYVNVTSATYSGGSTGEWPDPCVPYTDRFYGEVRDSPEQGWNKSIDSDKTQPFLAEIYIPDTAVAGTYTGTVRLTAQEDSSIIQDINVTLTVWNFSLPLQWSYGSTYALVNPTDIGTVFGTFQVGLDLLTKSAVDHGLWLYGGQEYMAPAVWSNGTANFADGSFNSPSYGYKRWLDGNASNVLYNPRPYNGVRPTAIESRSLSGQIDAIVARQVTGFADNGSGGTRVTVHYLDDYTNGDIVNIYGSTNYTGDWTITVINDTNFDIATSYVGNDASGCTWYADCPVSYDSSKIKRYYDSWATFFTDNGYESYTYIMAKLLDEESSPNCCAAKYDIWADAAMNGTSRAFIYPGQTIGADAGCNPWTGGCTNSRDSVYHQGWIVTETGGLIKPANGGAISPRSSFNTRVSTYGDKIWTYTANRQNEDYNTYGQTDNNTMDSWYIDTVKGGRENAASPITMWVWDVSGFHYYEIDGGINDISWGNPRPLDSGWPNGDGFLFYSGYASSAFSNDIGGTNNIPIESLRMELWRWGMNVMEYAKLLDARGKSSVATAQIANMFTMAEGPTGNTWGTVSAWEAAREAMANSLLSPEVNLISPIDIYNSSDVTIIFNCSVTGNNDLVNITLYGNWSGGWHANETVNLTGTDNSTEFNVALEDWVYEWNCLACDSESNEGWGGSNYTLTIDSTVPTVNLKLPEDNSTNTTSNSVDFIYNVSDFSDLSNCSLIINDKINISDMAMLKDTAGQNLTTYLPNAEYNWSVNCTDSLNNIGASEVRNISVNVAAGNTAPSNPTVVLNFTFADTNYTNESMWCEFTISDADAEAQMYVNLSLLNNTADNNYVEQWSLPNLPYSDETTVSIEVKEANFTKGDYVVCQVQVCDDESSCTSFVNSSSLKVENYPVKISDPLGNFTINEDFTNFSIYWGGNWTDADNTTTEPNEVYINWTFFMNDTEVLGIDPITINLNDTDTVSIGSLANASGTVEINWTVIDSDGATFNETVYWTINQINDQPWWDAIDDILKDEDFSQFTIDLSPNITDVEDDDATLQVSYEINNSNASLSFNNSTNILTVTAVPNASDTANISLILVDSGGLTAFESFDLILTAVNDAPWWDAIEDISVEEDFANFTISLNSNISDVEDPDSSLQVSYNLNSTDWIVTIDNTTNIITIGYFTLNASGAVNISLTVIDTGGLTAFESFDLIINAVDDTLWWDYITNNSLSINEDSGSQSVVNVSTYFRDVEDDQSPQNLMNPLTNTTDVSCSYTSDQLYCNPINNYTGPFITNITMQDSFGITHAIQQDFEITVNNVNDEPWWNETANNTYSYNEDFGADYTIWDGEGLNNTFWDVEDNHLPYNCTASTNDTSIITNVRYNGSILADSVANATGISILTVNCSDTGWESTLTSFEISINNVNDAPSYPVVSLSPLDGTASQDLTCTATVSDLDPSDTLTASIEWFKNNESNYSVSGLAVTNNIDFTYVFTASGNLTAGDEWGCGIAISDGTVNSSWANATQFTVISSNNPPSIPALNLPENNTHIIDSNLAIELNWSNSTDADGNPITYYLEIWNESEMQNIMYVNASISETANTTGDTVTFPNETNADFFWRVLATDGTANSSWSELRNISIGYTNLNNAPTTPTVVLNFTYAEVNYTNESMWCEFTISDPDSEAQMYVNLSLLNNTADNNYVEQWSLPNLPYSDDSTISLEINETNFTKGDFVVCQVQVCDDESSCSSFVNSSSLRVENYPVKISDPLGNFTINEDFTNFSIYWGGNWTDADNTTTEPNEVYINWTFFMNDTEVLGIDPITINLNDTDTVSIGSLANASGTVEINWTVVDSDGATFNETVYWTINQINDQPWWDPVDDISAEEDFANFTINLNNNISDVEDPDASLQVSYSLNSTDWIVTIENSTNIMTVSTFTPNASGAVNISLTLIDSGGLTAFESFDLIVSPVNDAPWWDTVVNQSVLEDSGSTITYNLDNVSWDVEDDANGINMTYGIDTVFGDTNSSGTNCSINGAELYCVNERENRTGDNILNITALDADGAMASIFMNVSTLPVNDAPQPVILNLPENETNWTSLPEFNWANTTDLESDPIYYALQIDDNPAFTEPVTYYNGSITETANTTADTSVSLQEDGAYYWRVLATDNQDNSTWPEARYFVYDTTPPLISLESPENNSANATSNIIDFTFNLTDLLDVANCTLIIDNAENSTLTSVQKNATLNITVFLNNADYEWSINCTDIVNNDNGSFIYNLSIVDNTEPEISLDSPDDGFETGSGTVGFNFTVIEPNLDTCELYGNWSDGWHVNQSHNAFTTGITQNFSNVSLTEGNYVWNVWCNDTSNNANFSASNRSFKIDDSGPSVTLQNPVDTENHTIGTVTFTYQASDLSSITQCQLYINNSLNSTSSSVTKDANQTFSSTLFNDEYEWYVRCTDSTGNTADSATRYLTQTCSETWSCTSWSTCSSGTQTRTCTDANSCPAQANKPSESQTCDTGSTSGGSGGGGGGGGGGGTSFTSGVIESETVSSATGAKAGETKTITFTKDVAITEVDISFQNSVDKVTLTAQKLNTKPAETTIPAGTVQSYLKIDKNLKGEDIEKAKIRFKVEKSWLVSKGFLAEEIILKRYDKRWEKLPTKQVKSDKSYTYYEADTKGFSYFAIVAEKKIPAPVIKPAIDKKEEEEKPEEALLETRPAQEKEIRKRLWYYLYYLGLIFEALIILTLMIKYLKRRNIKKTLLTQPRKKNVQTKHRKTKKSEETSKLVKILEK